MQGVNRSQRTSVPEESGCSFGMLRCQEEIFQGRGIFEQISLYHSPGHREVLREKSGLEPFIGTKRSAIGVDGSLANSKAIGHRHSKLSASKSIGAFTSPNQELAHQNYLPQRENDSQHLLATNEYRVGEMYPYLYMQRDAVPTFGNALVQPVYNLQLSSQANLQQHKEMHTSRRSSPYNISYRNLTGQNELLTHNESRTDERSFSCTECDKKFSQKRYLQRHQLTHTGERPYKCDFCAHTSATKEHLKRHQRKHTGERPFKCEICDYASADLSNLKRHVRRRHENSSKDTSTDSPTS